METNDFFRDDEKKQLFTLYRKLLRLSGDTLLKDDCRRLRQRLGHAWQVNPTPRDVFGLNPLTCRRPSSWPKR